MHDNHMFLLDFQYPYGFVNKELNRNYGNILQLRLRHSDKISTNMLVTRVCEDKSSIEPPLVNKVIIVIQ